ncbi:MAG TPA: AMP-binding protein [Steroidobacteraceae bacterium]|nr:AMP-binding protein [Steroidobacteraceae bacterium]
MNTSSAPYDTSSNTSPCTGQSSRLGTTLPLISHTEPDAVVAYRAGVPVVAREFLADVARVAAALPACDHILNVCSDRYRFTVGFAAGLVAGKVSLLPSTHTPEVIRQLAMFAPDVFCLTDDPGVDIELPRVRYPEAVGSQAVGPGERLAADRLPWRVPEINAGQLAAYVFTSGSTGTPLPYKKTWGRLLRCVHDGASRLGLLDGRSHTIVGTVPPQHMYGFESSVLVGLQTGSAICAERPFYPADICSVLAAAPRPRVLISTPVHLRALLAAEVSMPEVDLIVSATAPLSRDLAREVEEKFATRLLEIYGSTETGQIATRRTAQTLEWQLWPGVSLSFKDDGQQAWAQGGHVEQPTPMCDVLELTQGDRFLLHGRMADLVNIAGKRSSLAYLNHQLNSIPGVVDGTFFLPDESPVSATGVTRVAAFVVAPGLDAAALAEELRRRIDPVFLPRPLLFVEQLPRNGTGKLPREALRALAAQHLRPAS